MDTTEERSFYIRDDGTIGEGFDETGFEAGFTLTKQGDDYIYDAPDNGPHEFHLHTGSATVQVEPPATGKTYIAQPLNETTVYDLDTYLSEAGQRDFFGLKSSGGVRVDGTYKFKGYSSPAVITQVLKADGTTIAIPANIEVELTGKMWTAYRSEDGTSVRLIESAGVLVGETVEMGQATFTYNSAGALLGGSSGSQYTTSTYSFEIAKDGEYWFDCSCLQDVTLSGGSSTTPVGGHFFIGSTAGATDIATLDMGVVKIGYDDDNRDNQDVQTVSDKVKVTLTAGTYFYYMRTASPQGIGGSRQAHNLRGKLNWIGKATGEQFVKKSDVVEVKSEWVEVFNGSTTITGNLSFQNVGSPQTEITGVVGEEMLVEFGAGTADSVHYMMANGQGNSRRSSNNTRVDVQILASGQIQMRSSDGGNTGIARILVRKDSATVTLPDTLTLDPAVVETDTLALGPNNTIVKSTAAVGGVTPNVVTFNLTNSFVNFSAEQLNSGDVIQFNSTLTPASFQVVGYNAAPGMSAFGQVLLVNMTNIPISTDLPNSGAGATEIRAFGSALLTYTGETDYSSQWIATLN